MATGPDMLMAALKKLVPAHVWDAVEKNLCSIGGTAQAMQAEMKEIREIQERILRILEPRATNAGIWENGKFFPVIENEAPNGEATANGLAVVAGTATRDGN
jgi:hypothetical protein